MQYQDVKTKSGKIIKHEGFTCSLAWNYVICDGDNVIGRAIVLKREDYKQIIDEDEEIFVDICIYDEKYRNKGIGEELMKFILKWGNHKTLISSSLNKTGFNFALKTGWNIKKSMHKNTPDIFYYKYQK